MRDAGSGSRLGKVWKVYDYSLLSLLQAIDNARLRSYNTGPQVVTIVTGRRHRVIRRFEGGKEVQPTPPGMS